MAITAYYAWGVSKQFSDAFGSTRKSLTVIFLQQGVIRFIVIFLWTLEASITKKVLNPLLAGFDAPLEDSISSILICRFMLQLRKFNTRVQTVPSLDIASTPGVQGRLRRIHETIVDEFGDSGMEYSLEAGHHGPEPDGGIAPTAVIDTQVRITAEEFPWAINPVESIPGPSGTGNEESLSNRNPSP
ncbi:hypothetical protein M422DRAFT_263140 [Sphaerobolus stellatus SS14]|uniref:Uncharacterized protein n=1 Tax=Sphaerobolus stellatus (strain SS14) TaxID=990650 RepID=A0A0C9UZP3_SPHS4|nr:hypothetical protein M422DRAFT_263140 [Sphaerobolus stellatus SS14]